MATNESVIAMPLLLNPNFYSEWEGPWVDRLRKSINPETGLFVKQIRNGGWGYTHGTEALTSTAICMVGLNGNNVDLERIRLDLNVSLRSLTTLTKKTQYLGGIGLIIWANAVWEKMSLEDLLSSVNLAASGFVKVIKRFRTMEVAWLLTGLVYDWGGSPKKSTYEVLRLVLRELMLRYEENTGLFSHSRKSIGLPESVRWWLANFADQIYPLFALSISTIVFESFNLMEVVEKCARRLVELQGAHGQWWWHYDSRNGTVIQKYPVYSVHQYGMAPMAFMQLALAGGTNYGDALRKGIRWLSHNEMNSSMLDLESGTIWRDIEYRENMIMRYFRHLTGLLNMDSLQFINFQPALKTNYETRPYEWGWGLYAGSKDISL